MNNDNPIKLINENGVPQEYGRVPDLWHIASLLRAQGREAAGKAVLEVWHMAHDLKACVEGQGEARITESCATHCLRPPQDQGDGIPVVGKS